MGKFSNLVTAGIFIAFLAILFHYFCRVRKKPDQVVVQQHVQVPEGYVYPITANVNNSQHHSLGQEHIFSQNHHPTTPGPFPQAFQFPPVAAYAYPPAPGFIMAPNAPPTQNVPNVAPGHGQMYPSANAVNHPNDDLPPNYNAVIMGGNLPYPLS